MSQVAHQAGTYPGFSSLTSSISTTPLCTCGILLYHRLTTNIKFAHTNLCSWVERTTVRVQCLAVEHNTMSLASAQTRTA